MIKYLIKFNFKVLIIIYYKILNLKLIDDKKVLSEKCERLVKELKDVEKMYSDKLRNTEER